MIALGICLLAFVACYWAGRRSLGQGLVMLLLVGYFYGILRANLLTTFSHFIFDAGMIGLFLSPRWRRVSAEEKKRSATTKMWAIALMVWPFFLLLLPFQTLLVSLVGLRGNVFFIPLLLLGSRLREKDVMELSVGLAVLDLVAVGFGAAEYFLGVPRFFPLSPVTLIIYSSADVAGGFFRIPATFANAHAFGGAMVSSIPYLIGLWTRAERRIYRVLALIAMPAALIGVLMSATRTNFIFGCVMVIFFIFTTKVKGKQRIIFYLIIGAIAYAALTNARFQRFKSLNDAEYLSERIAGSVNRSFWEILEEYPMGNGLGGGGTSIPYFLEGQVKNPIGMENEYARILSEQGIVGLVLWLSLVTWFLWRSRVAFANGRWATTRRLLWGVAAVGLGTAWIGTGMLTAIPGTLLMMIAIGWTSVPEMTPAPASVQRSAPALARTYVPAIQ